MPDTSGSAPDFQAILDESGSATQNAIRLLWTMVNVNSQRQEAFQNRTGVWQDVPFDSTNYYGLEAGSTVTVQAGDVITHRYVLIGKFLLLNIRLNTVSVGGTPTPTNIAFKLPHGLTSASGFLIRQNVIDNNVVRSCFVATDMGSPYVYIAREDGSPFTASTNNSYFWILAPMVVN